MTVTRQGETVFENDNGDIVPGDDLIPEGIDPADIADALKMPSNIPEGDLIYLTPEDRVQLDAFEKRYNEVFDSLSDNYGSSEQMHAEVQRKLGVQVSPEMIKEKLIAQRKAEAQARMGGVAAKSSEQ